MKTLRQMRAIRNDVRKIPANCWPDIEARQPRPAIIQQAQTRDVSYARLYYAERQLEFNQQTQSAFEGFRDAAYELSD